jgi:spermidine synthase
MAAASDSVDPMSLDETEVERRIDARGLRKLHFYNGATHRAVMAMPNFVREILARRAAPVTAEEPLDDVPDPATLVPLALRAT